MKTLSEIFDQRVKDQDLEREENSEIVAQDSATELPVIVKIFQQQESMQIFM